MRLIIQRIIKVSIGLDTSLFVERLPQFVLGLTGILYALNVFGVLRLNTDVITLLGSALSDFHGEGRLYQGEATVFPPGYPTMVRWLLQWSIASTSTLVMLNLFFLGSGLAAYYLLARFCFPEIHSVGASLVCMFTALNWNVIKHAPLPLTDVPYFGLSMLSLLVIEIARRSVGSKSALIMLVLAIGLIFASISVRHVGIALIPALIFATIFWQGGSWRVHGEPLRKKLAGIAVVTIATAGLVIWWRSTAAVIDFPKAGSLGTLISQLLLSTKFHLIELAEILLNMPASKITLLAGMVGLGLGLVAVALLFAGILGSGHFGICQVYLLGYGAILSVWPYPDPRFLLPIIPLLIAFTFLGLKRFVNTRWLGVIVVLWGGVYLLNGTVALWHSARIGLSVRDFPDVYGDGSLRDTYCAHLKTCPQFDGDKVMPAALDILRAFEPVR